MRRVSARTPSSSPSPVPRRATVYEILSMYETSFAKITDKYFKATPWPTVGDNSFRALATSRGGDNCTTSARSHAQRLVSSSLRTLAPHSSPRAPQELPHSAAILPDPNSHLFTARPPPPARPSLPQAEAIAPDVDYDHVFCLLYKEIYFRHIFAKLTPTLEQRCESWDNYCQLFGERAQSPRGIAACPCLATSSPLRSLRSGSPRSESSPHLNPLNA